MRSYWLLALLLIGPLFEVSAQCALLTQLRDKKFVADGQCAPVNVTNLSVTYNFSVAQDPSDIVIRFIWNDPGNNITNINVAGGLVVTPGNRQFQATGNFIYDADENCFFQAEVFIVVDGVQCESSQEVSIIQAWDYDDDFGGEMRIDPNAYQICENNAVDNLIFTDNSVFNCNINISPNNPNEITRYTQFVYGTNHNPANALFNVDLNNGAIQLTNATGNALISTTQGTVGEQVTGLFFGDITEVPFPAQAPNNISLPISADASTIGSRFEVTLFNWNVCNEYNGDPINPNYEDAVREVVVIEVVDEPVPEFATRLGDQTGVEKSIFCIGEEIYFENETIGAGTYEWQFYNDNLGTTLLETSNDQNPIFQYNTGGEKLIVLTASNNTVAGDCDVQHSEIIRVSPDAISRFEIYDAAFSTIIEPAICESATTLLEIGLRDATTAIQAETEWRYEFYDLVGNLQSTTPADGTFSANPIADFNRSYTAVGAEVIRLVARNNITLCESIYQDTVVVYGLPTVSFFADTVCEGSRTRFFDISDSLSIAQRVNNDFIDRWVWDFSYENSPKQELQLSNANDFEYFLNGSDRPLNSEPNGSLAGRYVVGLSLTTALGGCQAFDTASVIINSNPEAVLSLASLGPYCPTDRVLFQNESVNDGLTVDYTLSLEHSPTAFSSNISLIAADSSIIILNPDDTTRTYFSFISAVSDQGCAVNSDTIRFAVSPDEKLGFTDENISFISSNCSSWNSTFILDDASISLSLDELTWIILDGRDTISGFPVSKINTETDFNELSYQVENISNSIKTYQAVLSGSKAGVCITSDTLSFQISPKPSSQFAVLEENECNLVTFNFTALETGLSSYMWIFNPNPITQRVTDNSLSAVFNRGVIGSPDLGVSVGLITTNLASCVSDTSTQNVIVKSQTPSLIADFTLSTDTLKLPQNEVLITNNSTNASGVIYSWDFGDGATFIGGTPNSHIYDSFGQYEIRLEVSDEFCDEVVTQTIVVLPADPIIDFSANILEGCAPLTVTFENLSQFTTSGNHLWEFGDGSISRADAPAFTYFAEGTYTVRLRGENEVGLTGETEKVAYIQVYGVPFADFLATPRTVYIPDQQVYFRNLSQNIVSQYWEFGDGQTSTEFEPRHNYLNEGQYDILLAVANEVGCVDTLFRPTEVTAVIGGNVKSPNAFTPSLSGSSGGKVEPGSNQDPGQINDVFLPTSEGITSFQMWVYNKWGQLLFESNDQFTGWDGYFNGRLAPAGVYVYKLDLKFSDGREEIKVGDVTLVR